jgi:hypothetical protein
MQEGFDMETVKGYFKRGLNGKVIFVEDKNGPWHVLKSDIPRNMTEGAYHDIDRYKRQLRGNIFQRISHWYKDLFTCTRINWQPPNLVNTYKDADWGKRLAQRLHDEQKTVYPMCKPQPVQLDCRKTDCIYHQNAGCTNPAPAVTLNENSTFICWTYKNE